ncbi:hypothetical protein [Methylacidimicrobium cyclopophantes]|nr:hypothetical protein [Methylacidimicrobium cyclopophantes]
MGLWPGERLREELVMAHEELPASAHEHMVQPRMASLDDPTVAPQLL